MADLFDITTSEEGLAMSTSNTSDNGDTIYNYGKDLSDVLSGFETAIITLKDAGMKGPMVDSAVSSYYKIKDTLDDYASRLMNTGLAVKEVAENTSAAANAAADNIGVAN